MNTKDKLLKIIDRWYRSINTSLCLPEVDDATKSNQNDLADAILKKFHVMPKQGARWS